MDAAGPRCGCEGGDQVRTLAAFVCGYLAGVLVGWDIYRGVPWWAMGASAIGLTLMLGALMFQEIEAKR